jgi:hypothetical protein
MTLPVPWQVGQVCWIEKKPCDMRTEPEPWHASHVFGCVPAFAPEPLQVSHVSIVGNADLRFRCRAPPARAKSSRL